MKYLKGKKNKKVQEEEYELEDSYEVDEEFEDDDEEAENSEEESENNSGEENESEDDDSEAEIYKPQTANENQNLADETDENFKPSNEELTEFNMNINNIHSSLEEVNKKMNQLLVNIKTTGKAEMKYGISYLDGKNNIMLTYLTNLIFYSLLKTNGESIKNHDAIKKLVYCKTLLERSKVIDLKLKTQIDRLLKLGEKDIKEYEENQTEEKKINLPIKNQNENNYRPRILDQEDDENEEIKSEEENQSVDENNAIDKKKLKYKVQKNFQEFFETTEENKSRHKKIQKMKEKIRNSEYYKELKDSFMETPKEIQSHNSEYQKFMNQVEDYENDNFTRVKISKRELKMIKKKDKKDNDFDDIGKEFKNFDRILRNETEEEFNEEKKFLNSKRMSSSYRGDSRGGRGGRGNVRGRGRGNSKFRGSFNGRGNKSFK